MYIHLSFLCVKRDLLSSLNLKRTLGERKSTCSHAFCFSHTTWISGSVLQKNETGFWTRRRQTGSYPERGFAEISVGFVAQAGFWSARLSPSETYLPVSPWSERGRARLHRAGIKSTQYTH